MPSIQNILMMALALLSALTVHEYAHARAAHAAGDDTAKLLGRLSLNPLVHLDPVGTVMMVLTMMTGFGIGWGKPVPVNPARFKNPRWDNLKVSLWGPLSNLLFAVILAVLFRVVVIRFAPEYAAFVWLCIATNLMLAVFNLIPIPPLDGSHILASLLPLEAARKFEYSVGRYGFIILLVILSTRILTKIIDPPVSAMLALLTGIHL